MRKLHVSFYRGPDVIGISRDLLGKAIVTRVGDHVTAGMISETEAYAGVHDRASHAYGGRRTDRTEVMFQAGGLAYVYLCYGIHHLFNVVTNRDGIPHAVLIRAIEPVAGIEKMLQRRGLVKRQKNDFSGPGKVSQALGIRSSDSGTRLTGTRIWIEDMGIRFGADEITSSTRIGVDYAGTSALLPYRFLVKKESLDRHRQDSSAPMVRNRSGFVLLA